MRRKWLPVGGLWGWGGVFPTFFPGRSRMLGSGLVFWTRGVENLAELELASKLLLLLGAAAATASQRGLEPNALHLKSSSPTSAGPFTKRTHL